MLDIHADKTSIVLERVGSDASGNNDRQRTTIRRMTIEEAEAFASELADAIDVAKEALALERMTRLAKVEAEIDEAERKVVALKAEKARLEGGDDPAARIAAPMPPAPIKGGLLHPEAFTHAYPAIGGVAVACEHWQRSPTTAAPTTPQEATALVEAIAVVDGAPAFIGTAAPAAALTAAAPAPTAGVTMKIGGVQPAVRPAPTDDELEMPGFLVRRTA